jgi:hypothetical protein
MDRSREEIEDRERRGERRGERREELERWREILNLQ